MSEATPATPARRPAPAGTIAFLGLGHMGGPMAVNLVGAGYTVTGFDVVPAALEAARAHGIATAETAAEAVAGAAVVLTMLPSGKHLLDAYRGSPEQQGSPGSRDCWPPRHPGPCSWTAPPSTWTRPARRPRWRSRPATGPSTPRSPAAWSGPKPAP